VAAATSSAMEVSTVLRVFFHHVFFLVFMVAITQRKERMKERKLVTYDQSVVPHGSCL
jgi:hypothetical protein